jgi:4-hydroxybenzoate polyprenyltransferase and related prenyltransferases
MQHNANHDLPLCTDLDGTIVKTDLLIESFFHLLKYHPLLIFLTPFWLFKGKAYLKQQIANRVELDVKVLPYHLAFLEYLRTQHSMGRRLVLATSSNSKFAHQVAEHLGLFNEVVASDDRTNLSGTNKLVQLKAAFGDQGFDYAGDSRVDLAIWPHAQRAILVNPKPGVKAAAERIVTIERVFDDQCQGIMHYLRAIRLHQWLKNLLVFVPLVLDHEVDSLPLLWQNLLAFLAFGFCASSAYLLNDLLDLTVDRHHPRKRLRPFAAGNIPILHGTLLIPVLLLSAFGIALLLPGSFLTLLCTYFILTLLYSLYFKGKLILDVLVLASLYTLRIIAGAAVTSTIFSFWLLAFSIFIFFSLAMAKRYSELLQLQRAKGQFRKGRGYRVVDLNAFTSFGAASGQIAVLVLALYINSDEVRTMYSYPETIWLLCPLLLYWVTRVWLLTGRGKMHDDPVVFAIRDRVSYCIAAAGIVILLLAV